METAARSRTPAEHILSRAERASRTALLVRRVLQSDHPDERAELQRQIVVLNLRVARAVAARYRGRGVPLEDLEQAACEGLLKAVQRFDPTREHDLLTFAVPTIRGEVLRHFRDLGWMVRPPRRVQELQWRIRGARESMSTELGRDPSVEQICRELGIDRAEHDEAVRATGCFQPVSLDQPGSAYSDAPLGEWLVDDSAELETVEARAVLAPLMRGLTSRDRRILELRFVEDRTQREIADLFGVSQMQVSRLLSRILRELREVLEGSGGTAVQW